MIWRIKRSVVSLCVVYDDEMRLTAITIQVIIDEMCFFIHFCFFFIFVLWQSSGVQVQSTFSIFQSIFNHITVTHIILIYAFDVNVTLCQSTTISHMIVVLIFRSILWSTDLINFISFLRYSIAKISQFTYISAHIQLYYSH